MIPTIASRQERMKTNCRNWNVDRRDWSLILREVQQVCFHFVFVLLWIWGRWRKIKMVSRMLMIFINLTPSFETIFQVKSLHFTCEVLSKAVNIIERDSSYLNCQEEIHATFTSLTPYMSPSLSCSSSTLFLPSYSHRDASTFFVERDYQRSNRWNRTGNNFRLCVISLSSVTPSLFLSATSRAQLPTTLLRVLHLYRPLLINIFFTLFIFIFYGKFAFYVCKL